MSKTYREQLPLLCDDLSEDDHYSPQYRRFRPTSCRSRTKNTLKGTAAIFTRWPGYWTSFLTYWWIALGMIAILTLIIYNILFAFAILPHDSVIPLKQKVSTNSEYHLQESIRLPDVYLHLFQNYNDKIDLHQYLPYIEIISNKFDRFKYHLIVVVNDTSINKNDFSAEVNNEIALNSLWHNEKTIKQKPRDNNVINIEYITLSKYMDNSPIQKYWRTLSHQLIEFLVRAISVWDKGGIALNPTILTPRSPNAVYIEKLQNILQDYKRFTKRLTKDVKSKRTYSYNKKSNQKVKQKVNNIRDIIDALNKDDMTPNSAQEMLAEAENKEMVRIVRSAQNLFSVTDKNGDDKNCQPSYEMQIGPKLEHHRGEKQSEIKLRSITDRLNGSTEIEQVQNSTTTKSLLPLFLDFLFHNKPNFAKSHVIQEPYKHEPDSKNNTNINNVTTNNINERPNGDKGITMNTNPLNDETINNKYTPMIISTKYVHDQVENSSSLKMPSGFENNNQLTIDLKGNIIATETPCHAFIGTLFSNAVHYDSATITDFIIAELSIFCKGVLSSCVGIDLILL